MYLLFHNSYSTVSSVFPTDHYLYKVTFCEKKRTITVTDSAFPGPIFSSYNIRVGRRENLEANQKLYE